ncbi:MAG: hypothetical protein V8R61_09870 [Enterocloster sp.]
MQIPQKRKMRKKQKQTRKQQELQKQGTGLILQMKKMITMILFLQMNLDGSYHLLKSCGMVS